MLSSAKLQILQCKKQNKSFKYMFKKIDSKTDPCGTPFRKSRPRAKSAVMGGEGGTCVDSRGGGLVRGIVAGSLGLSKSSGKTSYTIPHSFSNSFSMTEDAEVGDVSGEVTEVHVIDIFVGIDFQDLFSNFFHCGRFLKE